MSNNTLLMIRNACEIVKFSMEFVIFIKLITIIVSRIIITLYYKHLHLTYYIRRHQPREYNIY